MTDKEWKELCEWTKSLHYRKVHVSNKVFDGGCILIKDSFVKLMISNTGALFSKTYEKIADNRSSTQIKAIIENLL